jgi:4-phospho-D-threonate 3-dehydrogenase / 4-phospho-D-erythronate 3-dehydrogenase
VSSSVHRGGSEVRGVSEQESNKPVVAITMGDPCGIGPEIIVKALARPEIYAVCRPLVLGDRATLERALTITGERQALVATDTLPPEESSPGQIYLRPLTTLAPEDMVFGAPTVASGAAVVRYIREAARLCLSGEYSAMATAPINKEAMHKAGFLYPGHTELLAELTSTPEFVMMLAGERLRVTLVTIHEALADVPRLITLEKILSTIRVTHRDLERYFRKNPRIAVLALNPHSGEGGMFGHEEERIIAPAIALAQEEGLSVSGPHSADTLFHFALQGEYDAVVCMYHDQGLIPLKLLHFDDGVNVTLGLPIIRTSVDHGTAYNLAGTGRASHASMTAAILMAAKMAETQKNSP